MAKKLKIQWYPRQWRKKRGYNLERAAELAHMSVSHLSDLEKGNRRWNADHLDALASAYGIEPEDLLWNPEAPAPLQVIINKIAREDRENAAKALEGFIKKAS